jgi:glycine/D-amino acid oxidase-like deaminating enzyme/DNA integrity scanning protein DisA with diadenylate cyclase activity
MNTMHDPNDRPDPSGECERCGMPREVTQSMLAHAAQIAAERGAQALLVCGGRIPDEELLDFDFDSGSLTGPRTIVFLLTGGSGAEDIDAAQSIIRVPYLPPTRMSQVRMGVLLALSRGLLEPRDEVVCVTGMADAGLLDAVIVLRVGEEFEMFLGSNRERWESSDIRPDVLQRVLELTTELAVEGREGNPVGALFILGDLPHVLPKTHQMVLNPFHGYSAEQRNILDTTLLGETVKEFSTIDGAFLVHGDGTIESVGTHVDSSLLRQPHGSMLPGGLGARHRAAAAITAVTQATAVVLSQSTGHVTVFRKGQVVAEIPRPSAAKYGLPTTKPVAAHPVRGDGANGDADRVLVVGGGVAGLSIAWRLAETGAPVTLLEAGALGSGATTRNQGWLWSGALVARDQPELARMFHESLRRTLEFCPECVEPQTDEMLYLFTRPETRVHDWTDAWRSAGIPCEPVPLPAVLRALPEVDIHRVRAAFRLPDRAVRVTTVVNRLAVTARRAGVEIRTQTPIIELLHDGDTVTGAMTAAGEPVPARLVVLAAGSSAGTALRAWKLHLLAVRPNLGRTPFCLVDRDGFNHLPHGETSVFGSDRWMPADCDTDESVVAGEIDWLWQTLTEFMPGRRRESFEAVEWVGTTMQGRPDDPHAAAIVPPTVLEHPTQRHLVSAYCGRFTLWPLLAEQTRRTVLAALNTTASAQPQWAALDPTRPSGE